MKIRNIEKVLLTKLVENISELDCLYSNMSLTVDLGVTLMCVCMMVFFNKELSVCIQSKCYNMSTNVFVYYMYVHVCR